MGYDSNSELEELARECLLVLEFLREFDAPPTLFDRFQKTIVKTLGQKDLRGMRSLSRDFREMAGGLSPKDQSRLRELLKTSGTGSIEVQREADDMSVRRIIERNQVKSDDEFRRLVARADEIYADSSKQAELELINDLMLRYESLRAAEIDHPDE